MKRVLLLLFISLFTSGILSAQAPFWVETFGVGCASAGNLATPMGTWVITNTGVNGADANTFIISGKEDGKTVGQCGTSCAANDKSLHIYSPVAGDAGSSFLNGGGGFFFPQADQRCESPVINCTGASTITLKFNYLEFGDGSNDNAEVWLFDGTSWALLQDMPKTTCCGGPCNSTNQGNWGTVSIALPASIDNNPNVQIGFRWVNNDDGVGEDPAFAVDSVSLSVASSIPSLTITPSPNDTICQNVTLTLNGSVLSGGPIVTWAWTVSTPSVGVVFIPDTTVQNPNVTFTTPGTYTFTVFGTNAGPSTGSITQVITVLPVIVPTATITAPAGASCSGSNVCFTVTPTNGGAAPTFQWDVNGVADPSITNTLCSSVLNNNDVVSCTVTSNATPCLTTNTVVASFTVSISATTVPSVTITADDSSVCAGTTVNFTATPTNGGATPTYQWQLNHLPIGSNSPNFSYLPGTGPDTVLVIMTSSNPCSAPATAMSDTIFITVTPTIVPSVTITADDSSICAGTTINFTATPTNGGLTPAYQWQINGLPVGANSPNFSSSTLSGTDTVLVIMTSNGICPSPASALSDTIFVVVTPTVVVVTASSVTVCPNIPDTLIANAGIGATYTWSPAGGLNTTSNDTAIATNIAAGTYTYIVSSTLNGCAATNSITVTVPNTAISTAGPPLTVCLGQSASLSVTGGTSWLWTPATGNITCDTCQNTTATPTTTTTYSASVVTGVCTNTVTETVTVIQNASVSFNTNTTSGVPSTATFTNTSINATGYYWLFGDNLTSVLQTPAPHTYYGLGTYTVTLIAYGQSGCNDTLSTLLVITDTVGLTVPNIFTPNGDEINDVWQPNVHGAKDFECTIYDRWGLKVYEFAGDQDHWDGHTTAGLMCQNGTYYYILKSTLSNNTSYNLKGYIQLIH